jgi:hypothetical protein
MNVRVFRRWVWISLVSVTFPLVAAPREVSAAKPKIAPTEVALFDALARGQLAARFVPASEKKGVLTLVNRSRNPLAVQMPETLGARPILAQVIIPPQDLGLAMLPMQDRAIQNVAWKQNATRVVQIAPGGQAQIRLQGVCLDYGNPTPNSRMRYQIMPVEGVTGDARVAAALQSMAAGRSPQPVVQAVAWHLVNGKSWKALKRDFSNRELFAAQQLLVEVSKPAEQDAPITPAPATPPPKSTPLSSKDA